MKLTLKINNFEKIYRLERIIFPLQVISHTDYI